MTNRVRKFKPGDRVVQSTSSKPRFGFPWEIVEIWDGGEMAKLRYVGECGTLDGGYAYAVATRYLVKMS